MRVGDGMDEGVKGLRVGGGMDEEEGDRDRRKAMGIGRRGWG